MSEPRPCRLSRRCAMLAALATALAPAAARPGAAADRAGDLAAVEADPRLAELWRCGASECTGYTYDPLLGEPVHEIPPRTAFQDLPWDFFCPACGAALEEFRLLHVRTRAEIAGG